MSQNFKTILVMAVAILIGIVVVHQEMEIRQLREEITEMGTPTGGFASGSDSENFETWENIALLKRQAEELDLLRAQVDALKQSDVNLTALQKAIDDFNEELSAIAQRQDEPSFNVTLNGIGEITSRQSAQDIAAALARFSPVEAANWVAELPPGEEQNEAALSVIDVWADFDPAAAADWVSTFAEGELRERATWSVAREWGLNDWNATSDWLATLPMGASRDSAIDAFVTSTDGNDIQLALEWSNRIENPERRSDKVGQTAGRWLSEDYESAYQWITQASLPEGMAELLLNTEFR